MSGSFSSRSLYILNCQSSWNATCSPLFSAQQFLLHLAHSRQLPVQIFQLFSGLSPLKITWATGKLWGFSIFIPFHSLNRICKFLRISTPLSIALLTKANLYVKTSTSQWGLFFITSTICVIDKCIHPFVFLRILSNKISSIISRCII